MPKNVSATYPNILRTAAQVQTDTGLLWTPPSFIHRTGRDSSDSAGSSQSNQNHGMLIRSFTLQNLAVASPVGLGWRFVNMLWQAGRYDGTTYTVLANLQTRTSTAVQVAGADQTGFVILSREKFGWVSENFTTAETDAGGDTVHAHAVQYSIAGGLWTTEAAGLEDDFTQTNAVWSATIKNFVWLPSSTWVVTDTHTDLPTGYYSMRFTSAHREASDVAAAVTGIEIGGFADLVNSLAQNGIREEDPQSIETAYYTPWGNGLVAYFGTANAGNLVTAQVESA